MLLKSITKWDYAIDTNEQKQIPRVREYINYRKFLRDFFEYKKQESNNYSYRVFARVAGVSSPSHLKMVIDGKRNLTPDMMSKYLQAIKFEKSRDNKFFELLVEYEQTTQTEKKTELFQEVLKQKKKKGYSYLHQENFDFLTKWYYVAIYVLVEHQEFTTDPTWIQAQFKRKIAKAHIEKAINDMIKLNLLEFDSHKGVRQTQGALDTADGEVLSAAVNPYHRNMINLALDYLDSGNSELREFNGGTIPINAEILQKLKEKIRELRKEINHMTDGLEDVSDVYQFNIQLFPLTVGPKNNDNIIKH